MALRRGRIIPEMCPKARGLKWRAGRAGQNGLPPFWPFPQDRPDQQSKLTHDFLTATELTKEFLHRGRQRRFVQSVNHVLTLALVDDQLGFLEH